MQTGTNLHPQIFTISLEVIQIITSSTTKVHRLSSAEIRQKRLCKWSDWHMFTFIARLHSDQIKWSSKNAGFSCSLEWRLSVLAVEVRAAAAAWKKPQLAAAWNVESGSALGETKPFVTLQQPVTLKDRLPAIDCHPWIGGEIASVRQHHFPSWTRPLSRTEWRV